MVPHCWNIVPYHFRCFLNNYNKTCWANKWYIFGCSDINVVCNLVSLVAVTVIEGIGQHPKCRTDAENPFLSTPQWFPFASFFLLIGLIVNPGIYKENQMRKYLSKIWVTCPWWKYIGIQMIGSISWIFPFQNISLSRCAGKSASVDSTCICDGYPYKVMSWHPEKIGLFSMVSSFWSNIVYMNPVLTLH